MANICKFCNKLKENCCECGIEGLKERIQEVLRDFNTFEREDIELHRVLDKIKEIVDFS